MMVAQGGFDKKEEVENPSEVLLNPSDSEATFRYKAGGRHLGYVGNVVEAVGEKSSLVIDYDYQQNTYADNQFMKDYLNEKKDFSDGSFIVADGAYSGEENSRLASEHNLKLVTTNFTGRKPDEIYADFVFTDDGKYLIKCKNNRVPEDCIYDPGNERSVAYFRISDCEGCPYKERCQSRFLKTRVRKEVSWKSVGRAKQFRFRGSRLPQLEGTYRREYQRLGEQDHRRADRRRLAKERSPDLQGRGDHKERIRRQTENHVPYPNQLSGLEKTIANQHERPPTLLSLDRDRSLYLPSGQRTAVVAEDLAGKHDPQVPDGLQVSRLGLGIGRHRAYLHLVFRHGRANHHGVVLLPHPANQRLASVAVHVPAHPLIQGKERDPEEYPPPRHAYDRTYRSLHDRLSLPGGCPYVSFRRMVG